MQFFLKFLCHIQDNILFVQLIMTDAAGIFTTMSGVNDNSVDITYLTR